MSGIGPITGADPGGVAFPDGHVAGRRRFRTDLGMEFYDDGTRWLSTELHHERINVSTSGGLSASSTDRAVPPCGIGMSIYVEKVTWRTTLAATSDASNYWSFGFNVISDAGGSTALGSAGIDTKADAASATAIRVHTSIVNTVLDLAAAGRFEFVMIKTLSPSNLVYVSGYSYRWTAA